MSDLIDDIIKREGASGVVTNDPADRGGRTQYGISERANPDAWADGKVTYDEARAIYQQKYVDGPGFRRLTDPHLRGILADFAVTSGPALAITALQRALKVEADGVLGPVTIAAANASLEPQRLVNKIAVERIKMAGRIVKRDPSQLKWINGWLDRFASFID
jgi:lysozyme family protein